MPNEENSEEEEVEVVIDTPSDGATAFMMENQGKSRDRSEKKRERRIRFGPAQRPTQEAVWILLGGEPSWRGRARTAHKKRASVEVAGWRRENEEISDDQPRR